MADSHFLPLLFLLFYFPNNEMWFVFCFVFSHANHSGLVGHLHTTIRIFTYSFNIQSANRTIKLHKIKIQMNKVYGVKEQLIQSQKPGL